MSVGDLAGRSQDARGVARVWLNLTRIFAALVRAPRPENGTRPQWPAMTPLVVMAVALGAAIIASMVFVDAAAFAWAKQLPRPLVQVFSVISDSGKSGWFLYPTGVFVLLAALCSSERLGRMTQLVLATLVVRIGFVFVAIGLPGLVVTIVKRLIGRVRPSDHGPFAYEPWSWKAAYASLPSGHATTAFGALIAIGMIWPRTRPILWFYALAVALSRVVVTAHFPSDVLAGAAVGCLGALLVRNWFAARRLGFTVGPDGSVTPMPGPSLQRVKRVARRIAGY